MATLPRGEVPKGCSASNHAENVVRRATDQMRTLRLHLEEVLGKVIPDDVPVMSWLATWAGDSVSPSHLKNTNPPDKP